MPARRCSMCGISYPMSEGYKDFKDCYVCGDKTSAIDNDEPDENWSQLVTWKRRDAWLARQAAEVIPGPKDGIDLLIYEEGGLFWVSDWDLRCCGITPPGDRRLFLFRANGHVWEAQGWDEPKRRWWVEEVVAEVSALTAT